MFAILACFTVSNSIDLRVSIQDNHIFLDWTGFSPGENLVYSAYSQRKGSDWKILSTFDPSTTKSIKVLNVYPETLPPNAVFTFLDQSNVEMPPTAALKMWMEGGSYTYNEQTLSSEAFGKFPSSADQVIKVTPISKSEFDLMSLDDMKNYDVIVFGFMDANGLTGAIPTDDAINRVSAYIDLGYGVLFGHGCVGYYFGNNVGYGKIADKFGIKLGTFTCPVSSEYCSDGELSSSWMYVSEQFLVKMRGLPTNYPYQIPSGAVSIIYTHTCMDAAFGDVWMELGEMIPYGGFSIEDLTEAKNYQWALEGYSEVRYGNPQYYLTTYRNTGMIQIGHTLGDATDYERQVLANTICYLYQRTSLQYSYDNSIIDTPKLDAPTITRIEGERSVELSCQNASEEILYYVVGRTDDGSATYQSDVTQFNLVSNAVEYYYIIDKTSETIITEEMESQVSKTKSIIENIADEDVYIHVASVDNFGKLSETSHLLIEKSPQEETSLSEETASESQETSQINTFTSHELNNNVEINQNYTMVKVFWWFAAVLLLALIVIFACHVCYVYECGCFKEKEKQGNPNDKDSLELDNIDHQDK